MSSEQTPFSSGEKASPSPNLPRRTLWGLVALLALSNLLAYGWIYPLRKPLGKVLLDDLPDQVEGWRGEDMEVGPEVYRILRADTILARRYQRGGRVMEWMVIVARDRRSVHLPTSCYRVGGWILSPERERTLRINGEPSHWREVRVEKEGQAMLVWYTFSDDHRTVPNWLQQQWYMAWELFRRQRRIWAVLQLAAPLQGDTEEEVRQRIMAFLRTMLPTTQAILRRARLEKHGIAMGDDGTP